MKSIYLYNSKENMYSDLLCLVDKARLFDFLENIINKIDMDFYVEETENLLSIIFSNGKNIKVYDEFTIKIDDDFTIEINDDNALDKIIGIICTQIPKNVASQENKKEELINLCTVLNYLCEKDNGTKTTQVDDLIKNLCKDFGVEHCLEDNEFCSMITTESDVCDDFNNLSLEEKYKILIYLAYINFNVDIDLKLRFRKPYIGLFNEEERKFYCMILFSRNVLRIDGEDRLSIKNLKKFDLDQCFGFNGVPEKKTILKSTSNPNQKKNTITNTFISKHHYFYDDEEDEFDDDDNETCPWCGARLELKHGKYGWFYGCSRWPRCNYTRDE